MSDTTCRPDALEIDEIEMEAIASVHGVHARASIHKLADLARKYVEEINRLSR